jgi:Zn-dependent metalloprotease
MKHKICSFSEKIALIALTGFFTFFGGVNAHAGPPSSIAKLYTSSAKYAPLPHNTTARMVRPGSEAEKVSKEFFQLYKEQKRGSHLANKTMTPRLTSLKENELNKYTPATATNSTLLNRKSSVKSSIKMKMGALGTPAYIGGLDKVSMLRSSDNMRSLTPNEDITKNRAEVFFTKYAGVLKLANPIQELKLTKSQKDEIGQTHSRYLQSYKGIPVWGAGLILHMNDQGDVTSMDGKYIPSPSNLSTKPGIDAESATLVAEQTVLLDAQVPTDSTSQLVIYADEKNSTPALAWEITLDISITEQWVVLVNAVTSKVILSFNNIHTNNVQGKGLDVAGNTRPLNAWQSASRFFLIDASKSMFDASTNPLDPETSKGVIHIFDAHNVEKLNNSTDVTSSSATGEWLADGVGASFGLSETYDYYLEKHKRNSLDGKGGDIRAIVRYGKDYFNAGWSAPLNLMVFGDADTFTNALDVIGHELTHGVTSNESNLIYLQQSGALNEALSDIFGEVIENNTFGQTDWITGTGLNQRQYNRSLRDPASKTHPSLSQPYPSKMSEYLNLPPTEEGDHGGVHINSSIINHAFYQLAEGLKTSIGIDQAADIFYRANTTHLLQRSDFSDARRACIQSADDLFSANSTQSQAVAAAFDKVEIFAEKEQPEPEPAPSINAEDSVLMLFKQDNNILVGRRENGLGDPPQGSFLSQTIANPQRPAISGDGSLAAFIRSDNDICLIHTDGSNEKCLGKPGTYSSVAFSPDGKLVSLILRDTSSGGPLPSIFILNLSDESVKEITLESGSIDGAEVNTLEYADSMDFTADSRYLIYDALNKIELTNGSNVSTWSIYARDLVNNNTFTIVAPEKNTHFSFPNLSNINNHLITFDAYDTKTKVNSILVGNLATGKVIEVDQTDGFSVPALNGDDTSIIYTRRDTAAASGLSLFQQPLHADTQKPDGQASLWMRNGFIGTLYRRGTFVAPTEEDDEVSNQGGEGSKGGGGGSQSLLWLSLLFVFRLKKAT